MVKQFPTQFTEKVTPVADDFVLIADSADSNRAKYGKWGNLIGATWPTGAASTVTGPTGGIWPTWPTGAASTVTGPTGPTGAASTVTWPTGADSTVTWPTWPTGAASTVTGPTWPTGAAWAWSWDMVVATYDPDWVAAQLVGRVATQTLTNKTLTSPVINTPTGIVKWDVWLWNVDNTSDATKNSATVTLTNKTLTSPVINVTSDATWDTYHRNAWWLFTRLPIGTASQVLTVASGVPSWAAAAGWGGFWTVVAGTPTRTSDTVFTVTDTANANLFNQLLQRGTVLKRTQAGVKQAMVVSATYSANVVTVTIIWDTFSVGFTDMRYGLEKARMFKFAVAGTIWATGTDVANNIMVESPTKIYWVDFRAGTAWSGTTTVDINKNATTMFTTKPSILTTNKNILWVRADNWTTADTGDYITLDVDAVAGTTKIIDAYVNVYYLPLYMANLA